VHVVVYLYMYHNIAAYVQLTLIIGTVLEVGLYRPSLGAKFSLRMHGPTGIVFRIMTAYSVPKCTCCMLLADYVCNSALIPV
jgi:hypothetical protein